MSTGSTAQPWRWGEKATYRVAHRRYEAWYGRPARAFACVGVEVLGVACDRAAEHFSQDHTDPSPQFEKGRVYTLNPRHVSPRCAVHNLALDWAVRRGEVEVMKEWLSMPATKTRLSPGLVAVLDYLRDHADPHGIVEAKAASTASEVGASKSWVEWAWRELVRRNLVVRLRRGAGRGGAGSRFYAPPAIVLLHHLLTARAEGV